MVWRWQQRFAEEGVEGLLRDKTRKPGKVPTTADTLQIPHATINALIGAACYAA